jgi:flagellar basal-body rod protein FlgB
MFSVDPILQLLGRALDVSALRHSVHAANVANVNTDGYSRFDVIVDALPREGAAAIGEAAAPEARVVAVPGETVRLDEEMAAMAQNAMRYQTLLGAMEKSMSLLRYAAREGRE